jgi:TolB protein
MTRGFSPSLIVTRRRALAFGAGAALMLSARHAAAQLHLDITQGNFQPMPIAIPEFIGATPADADMAHGITQIITANLQRSGLFAPIDPSAYIEKIVNFDTVPNFQDWRAINAQALITGEAGQQSDGRLRAEFRLWDVLAGQQIGGQRYVTTADNWRRLAHIISDAVYERITGNKGYFDSHIVFVDETGPKERRIKRLALMDQDGANVRYLTRGDELVLTPRFSPSSQEVAYQRARERRQFSRHELFAAIFA